MARKKQKNTSLKRKVLFPMILVTLVQAVLFYTTMVWGGAVSQLNENAFDIFNQRVINCKNDLENEMLGRWSDMGGVPETVQTAYESLHVDSQPLSGSGKEELLSKVSQDIADLLRINRASGAFLVLANRQSTDGKYDGLYLRDPSSSGKTPAAPGLLLEIGPMSAIHEKSVFQDEQWTSQFDSSRMDLGFLEKPLFQAEKRPELSCKDLGYWSRPFRLHPDDAMVLTYSQPLRDQEGRCFGVIGVEISLDRLSEYLPFQNLNSDGEGAFLLAVGHAETDDYEHILSNGPAFSNLFGDSDSISLASNEVYPNCQRVADPSKGSPAAFACVHKLSLYSANTPFEDDQWTMIGILPEKALLKVPHRIVMLMIVSMGISLTIGVVSTMIVSIVLTTPITELIQKLRGSDPRHPIHLDRTRISEIDELAQAVEALSNSVADASSKMQQIVEVADLSIGVFEYSEDDELTYCTGQMLELLDLDTSGVQNTAYLKTSVLLERLHQLENAVEQIDCDGREKTYHLVCRDGTQRWVKIQFTNRGKKTFGVAVDVTRDILEKRKIEYDRDYDLLTNLLNRRAFYNALKEIFHSPGQIKIAAMVMLDLDNLKYVNDTYGHDYGDTYIRTAAEALKKFTPFGAVISRMSGDEFFLFLYGYESKQTLREVLEKLKDALSEAYMPLPNGETYKLRASVGISWYPQDAKDYETLIRYADFAMYKVKNSVKGGVHEFNMASYQKDAYLLHAKGELNKLIDEECLTYVFQPIVDAVTGRVFAYEALMRSQLPTLKSPFEILSLARAQSQLYPIERLTWFKAMEEFVRRCDQAEGCRIFINSIPNQVLTDSDVRALEERFSPYLNRVVLELTEEEKLDEAVMEQKQQYLKRWNGQFAIDDFGTGYNGESVLLSYTPQYVKADMSIIRNIDQDENRQRILKNLVSYAGAQHIRVIAEGVETRQELMTVMDCGVDYLQGFYIGVPAQELQPVSEEIRQLIVKYRQRKQSDGI